MGRKLVNVLDVVKDARTVAIASQPGNQLGDERVGGVVIMLVHDDGTVEIGASSRGPEPEFVGDQPYIRDRLQAVEEAFEFWANRYRGH